MVQNIPMSQDEQSQDDQEILSGDEGLKSTYYMINHSNVGWSYCLEWKV